MECGYSASGTNAARAWRYTPGVGLEDLGFFGGTDTRALGINPAGQVTGHSTDTTGGVHGFRFSGGVDLLDVGGFGVGTAQAFTADSHAFLFTDGVGMTDLGRLCLYHHERAGGGHRAKAVRGFRPRLGR
jgi:probable HAF family extracellular repeat protein